MSILFHILLFDFIFLLKFFEDLDVHGLLFLSLEITVLTLILKSCLVGLLLAVLWVVLQANHD